MPYNYRESTTLSQQNKLALRSLAATGELPRNHYWNALRVRHDTNPTRFERANLVLGALLNRDQLQRQGVLSASAPLFSRTTGFFAFADARHALNSARFDFWHPFLGRLFDLVVPRTPAGQGVFVPPVFPPIAPAIPPLVPTVPPLNPDPPILPPPGGGGDTGTPPIGPGVSVPEPASGVLLGMALAVAVIGIFLRKRTQRRGDLVLRPAVAV